MALPDQRQRASATRSASSSTASPSRQISEVSGLKMDQDVIEYKHNTPDGKYLVKKLPGRPKPGEVTLTRGLTEDNSFDNWVKNSQFGKMGDARKGGAIIVYDFEGNPIKRYKLENAWPKGLELERPQGGRHVGAHREAHHHLRGAWQPDDEAGRRQPGHPGAAAERTEGEDPVEALRTEFEFELPRGLRRRRRRPAPAGRHAPGHGPRRAGPAARRPGPGEPGLPHRRPAGPGASPGWGRSPTSTPAWWRTCSPPTSPSSRTSTAGSTRRATPGPR